MKDGGFFDHCISQKVGIWLVVVFVLLLILRKNESEINLQELTVIATECSQILPYGTC